MVPLLLPAHPCTPAAEAEEEGVLAREHVHAAKSTVDAQPHFHSEAVSVKLTKHTALLTGVHRSSEDQASTCGHCSPVLQAHAAPSAYKVVIALWPGYSVQGHPILELIRPGAHLGLPHTGLALCACCCCVLSTPCVLTAVCCTPAML